MCDSLKKKLSSNKGETLVEVLMAILISVLSTVLLLSATMAAANMNKQAKEADAALNEQQVAAEGWDAAYADSTPGTLTVLDASGNQVGVGYEVTVYGDSSANELISYEWTGA